MQRVRIDFPGTRMHFNKSLLRDLVKDIQNNLPEVKIQWFKCKPPWNVMQPPSKFVQSSFEDANMVVLVKNGIKILESYKYRSGGGSIFIYEKNLTGNDVELISKIFQSKGFVTPAKQKAFLKIYGKSSLFLFLAFLYTMVLLLSQDFIFTFPIWPGIVIVFPVVILLILSIYFLIKGRRIMLSK